MPRPDLSGIVNNDPNDADPVSIAFKYLLGTYTEDEIFVGKPHAYEPETVEISSGAVTVTKGILLVTGQGGNADNLDTINQPTGDFETGTVIAVTGGSGVTSGDFDEIITVRHSQGNILLATDASFIISRPGHSLTLRWDGTNWVELARSGLGRRHFISSSSPSSSDGQDGDIWLDY